MQDKISAIQNQFAEDLASLTNPSKTVGETPVTTKADTIYLKYFSKKNGLVAVLLKELAGLSLGEKQKYGPILNQIQDDFQQKLDLAIREAQKTQEQTEDAEIDLTLPYPSRKTGQIHPTNRFIREMNKFFTYYGYSIMEGPEIENAEYNFRRLNLPENHPATDLQDTLFIKSPDLLLRTHTSSVEARILTDYKPPIRAVVAGKVYRNETLNRTNSSFFYQYQGIVVDKGITIQHLKGTLELFHQFLFGEDVILRFRYKYYPEVSPGMGTDMQCQFCMGAGCPVCKGRGWVEVLGSGMIHCNTLKMCGIDPEIYTGFAFGMGLDRLVMQKYGIDDIRRLYGEVFEY